MLIDRGLLARDGDGTYRPIGDIGQLDVPESLHALVAARLDALPDAERRLVQQASVLGKTFTVEGLAAVSGLPADEVGEVLEGLARKEIVRRETDPFAADRGHHGFLQGITRVIAYETLSRRDRKTLHLAAATYLASVAEGDELVEVIAAHRLDAYRLLPDDADAAVIRTDAVSSLERAAIRAASVGAPEEALRLVEQMLELTEDPEERMRLLAWAGQLAEAADLAEHAKELLLEALAMHNTAGDPSGAARVQVRLAQTRWLLGEANESLEDMEAAYAVLRDGPQTAALAELAAELARLRRFQSSERDAAEPLERAFQIAAALDLPDVLAEALNTKGTLVLTVSGRIREGRALVEGALAVSRERDLPRAELRALFNLGFFEEITDELTGLSDNEGLDRANRLGDRGYARMFLHHIAVSHFLLGDWDQALAAADQALAGSGDESSPMVHYSRILPNAIVHAARGNYERAGEEMSLRRGDEHAPDNQDRAVWCGWSSLVELFRDNPAEALRLARIAVDTPGISVGHPAEKIAGAALVDAAVELNDQASLQSMRERLESLSPGGRPPFARALLAKLVGLLDGDDDSWRRAEQVLRELRYREPLARCLEQHALQLLNGGRRSEVEGLLEEAKANYAQLGMQPALGRLDRLVRRQEPA
jgi:tetratricopeptide (TPR) repeat protein